MGFPPFHLENISAHELEWNPDITLRCQTAADTLPILGQCSGKTEGYTGAGAVITNGRLESILICDLAFKLKDLPETILHEMSHALEWTFDKDYCNRTSGCSLDTDEAKYNGDSYSGFAGEALDRWGP